MRHGSVELNERKVIIPATVALLPFLLRISVNNLRAQSRVRNTGGAWKREVECGASFFEVRGSGPDAVGVCQNLIFTHEDSGAGGALSTILKVN